LIFAALERWLLQLRETDSSFVFIIFAVLLGKIESVKVYNDNNVYSSSVRCRKLMGSMV